MEAVHIDHWREFGLESNEEDFSMVRLPPLLGITGFNKCLISVNAVTFTNTIRTLKKDDYITINGIKYVFNREMSGLNPGMFLRVLSHAIEDSGVTVNLTETNIFWFHCTTNEFTIDEMSYNVSLLIGIKQKSLPRTATRDEHLYEIRADRFGDYNSTPIFYLMTDMGISGDGSGMYVQTEHGMSSHNMFMRFNNSWNPEHPVNYIGGDVKYYANSSVLGQGGWIRLVDANLERVDLLNPLYVSIYVEFVKETNR